MSARDNLFDRAIGVDVRPFSQGPWMLATSCSWRRILDAFDKPVLMPSFPGKNGEQHLEVSGENLRVILAAPQLLGAMMELLSAVEPLVPDFSDSDQRTFEDGCLILKELGINTLEQDTRVERIIESPWGIVEGDRRVMTGRGVVQVAPTTHSSDGHIDLYGEGLELAAQSMNMLLVIMELLAILRPADGDFTPEEHRAYRRGLSALGDIGANHLIIKHSEGEIS